MILNLALMQVHYKTEGGIFVSLHLFSFIRRTPRPVPRFWPEITVPTGQEDPFLTNQSNQPPEKPNAGSINPYSWS